VRRLLLEALTEFLESPATDREATVAEWRINDHARRRGRTAGAGNGSEKERAKAGAKGSKHRREEAPNSKADAAVAATSKIDLEMDVNFTTTATASTSTTPTPASSARPARSASATATQPTASALARPAILNHLTIGINDCTRALESRIRWGRWELGDLSAAPPPPLPAYSGPPALRRGHKRKHRSARTAAAPTSDSTTDRPAEPAAPTVVQPTPEASTAGLPPFLLPPQDTTGPVLLQPNHDQLKPANPRFPSTARSASSPPAGVPIIDLVFVCRPDINPPALVAHLPTMAAAANGVREALLQAARVDAEGAVAAENGMEVDVAVGDSAALGDVKPKLERPPTGSVYLVPLDVGAEHALAATLALRRVAAIGISVSPLPLSTAAASASALLDANNCSHTVFNLPPSRKPRTSPGSSRSSGSTLPPSRPLGSSPTS